MNLNMNMNCSWLGKCRYGRYSQLCRVDKRYEDMKDIADINKRSGLLGIKREQRLEIKFKFV